MPTLSGRGQPFPGRGFVWSGYSQTLWCTTNILLKNFWGVVRFCAVWSGTVQYGIPYVLCTRHHNFGSATHVTYLILSDPQFNLIPFSRARILPYSMAIETLAADIDKR